MNWPQRLDRVFGRDRRPSSDFWREGYWSSTKAGNWKCGGPSLTLDDSDWHDVDLPHDFMLERPFVPECGLPELPDVISTDYSGSHAGAVGWYRKHFTLPPEARGKRIHLHFGGVFRNSEVYLNQFLIAREDSGYSSFFFDLTDFVNEEEENVLAVKVDATRPEGWWYEGGGIYRHVRMESQQSRIRHGPPPACLLWTGASTHPDSDTGRFCPPARSSARACRLRDGNLRDKSIDGSDEALDIVPQFV